MGIRGPHHWLHRVGIGRAFHAKYGFALMHEKVHEETGLDIMRLRFAANTPSPITDP